MREMVCFCDSGLEGKDHSISWILISINISHHPFSFLQPHTHQAYASLSLLPHSTLSLPPTLRPFLIPINLLRRPIKSMRNLLLPPQPILAENLGRDIEDFAALEQTGAYDNFGAEHGLVVVDVRGAVGAVVAVDWFAF